MRRLLWCAVLLLLLAAPAWSAPTAWLSPSWQRVKPDAAAVSAPILDICQAQNEWESAQVVVRGPASNVRVAVGASPLTVKLYLERYHTVSRGTATYSTQKNRPEGPGKYPDALLPMPATIALSTGQTQPIWVDVYAPVGVRGRFAIPLTISAAEGSSTLTLNVTVWGFALPAAPALQTAMGTWPPNRGNAALEALLLENRLQCTWIGGANTAVDIALGQTGASVGFWASLSSSSWTIARPKPTAADVTSALAQYPGLPLPYSDVADEVYPPADKDAQVSALLRDWSSALAGRVKRMVTIAPRAGWEWMDIFVELPKFHVQANVDAARSRGSQVWSYNTLAQDDWSPKWLLDFGQPNFRLQAGMLNWRSNLTGLLYWKIDQPASPWDNVQSYSTSYPGEAQLVYKPTASTFAPSVRLKWLRDGVDDFDYLTMLAARGQGDWARSTITPMATDWRTWSRDPVAIEAARRQLGARLDDLMRPKVLVRTDSYSIGATTYPDEPSAFASGEQMLRDGIEGVAVVRRSELRLQ
jgi:hypothetical protein